MHGNEKQSVSNAEISELLAAKGYLTLNNTTAELKRVVSEFAKKGCFDQENSSFFSLVYWSYKNKKETHWNFLYWFINYTLDHETNHANFKIMRYLYNSETYGNTVRRSFFPFCTYDTVGETSDFSFLWRIWHRRKDKDGNTSGHIFFIPWGSSK